MEYLLAHAPLLAAAADDWLAAYGLPAIFLVMLLKETGLPIPIPADLIMLGAAARAATGQFDLVAVVLTFEVAMLAGSLAQFALARGPGRSVVYRFGRYVGLTRPRLDAAGAALRRGGVPGVSVSLMTPGLRAATVAAAGLADLPLRVFLPGALIGNTVFFLLHVAIGYAGGQGLEALGQLAGIPAGPGLAVLAVAVLAFGVGGWVLLRRRAARARTAAPGPVLAEAAGAALEACCPACLALAAARQLRAAGPVAVEP